MPKISTKFKRTVCVMVDHELVDWVIEEAARKDTSQAAIVRLSLKREKRLSDAREQRKAAKAAA